MNLAVLLASALLVHVPIEDSTQLRLVAAGTDGQAVDWYVDQTWVASTPGGEAATIEANCPCDVWATTAFEGEWRALVRPTTGTGPGNMAYVDGWSNHHAPPTPGMPLAPLTLVFVGLAMVFASRFRPKRP